MESRTHHGATEARLTQEISRALDQEYGVPVGIRQQPWPLATRLAQTIIGSGILREIEEQGIEKARTENQYHAAYSDYPKGPTRNGNPSVPRAAAIPRRSVELPADEPRPQHSAALPAPASARRS